MLPRYVQLIKNGEKMNDEELVKRFRGGDREAFGELVQKYSRPLTVMILRIVRDEEEARDVSQTAFLRAYEGLPRFLLASSFKTWLYSIALNAARDSLRKRKGKTVQDISDTLSDPRATPAEELDRAQSLQHLRLAVEELPEKQRLTLQLRVYEEMDYTEIAKVLGGTAGGARGNFFQAARTLRKKLGADIPGHDLGTIGPGSASPGQQTSAARSPEGTGSFGKRHEKT